jgi:uncharacterized protein (TIGR02284 family)
MATRVGTEDNPVEMLEHLMALDFDAIEAYQAAIERLDNEQWKAQMATFRSDHERHTHELKPLIRAMGGNPPTGPDSKAMLTEGKVRMANLMGDEAILKAMRTNEDDTNAAYERAFAKCPPEACEVLSRGLDDEHRHREWIVATLEGRPVRDTRGQSAGVRSTPPPL